MIENKSKLSALVSLVCVLCIVFLNACATMSENNKADTKNENALSAKELESVADDAFRSGDWDTAKVNYALILEKDTSNVSVMYKLGLTHQQTDSLDVAEALFRRVLG